MVRRLKGVAWPPSLMAKQLGSLLLFRHVSGWKKLPSWLMRHGLKALPVSAGATGMGCIGFPAHPAWEVTAACNLTCVHCHAAGGRPAKDELSTDEAKQFIDQLARAKEFRMLVYTGGEPLVRPDLFELLHYSKKAGFWNVIATNGTLITDDVAFRLRDAGVVGLAVSLDAANKEVHNRIRANPTAFDRAMRGIRAIKKAGMLLQVNTTAMEYNVEGLKELIARVDELNASIMLMYQLVTVGRGEDIQGAALDIRQNERLLKFLAQEQNHVTTVVEPVAGPQYWASLLKEKKCDHGIRMKLAQKVFHGCAAARGFVYIKANGDVWPCPFVEVSGGNVRERDFVSIYRNSEVFQALRNREQTLKGKCGECKFNSMCGGCRGRAHAVTGDYLAEDPSCFLRSEGTDQNHYTVQAACSKESLIKCSGGNPS